MPEAMFDGRSRILVVGTSGSGKSTFAGNLSRIFGLKDIELDALFWKANWTQSDPEEFRDKIARAMENTSGYVIHGNYGKVRDLTWANADTVIWLDYSRFVVMWRVLKRTIGRILTGEVLWSGNRETFRNSFLARDAIVFWAWKTYRKRKEEYREILSKNPYGIKNCIIFRKPVEAREFIAAQIGATSGR